MYYEQSSDKRKSKNDDTETINRTIRLFDIIAALLAIVISAPVTLIIAFLIKLDDPKGPIFFKQQRIGKNQRPFYMYKFRSMHVDAEAKLEALLAENEMEGHMFKMKNDPRITKIGRFIRKTSLDEFPQFLNILKGDMSFVGPRPPLEREVANYTEYDLKRLAVTPGCTGLWQVSGRNTLTFEQMVELDLKYIRERSMWLNIKILCATFKEFAGKGM
ncbi:sugar transferase [Listeria booriae]|uniref:Sugar transferase n=1 Tax=Listeria booriae TaxID=1552123 RepID=A0A7X0YSL0_9LIST|nr:sugar transferase [Listeria booriae]MBC1210897.1 sugar transferase [Listeria booriae]MBC1227064.1 sugar transferase [Listeria booriae]MBC1230275.1 sugar transferase [Listeria booriae]MBC1233874.1 sugar transferase [Listeria booriae]MBC1246122.1 sugar transferase [Listeria booriae]